jgi:BCCT family betaine/carnitine transporter
MKKKELKKALIEIDKKIYFTSFSMVILIVIALIFIPDAAKSLIESAFNVCINKFGWLYILTSVLCFALFFYLYFGKYGNIKLGKPEDKPRFSTFSWAAMIFTSGAGSSTIILGFSEPIYYLTNTPFHVNALSEEAYEYAHMYGQFHWGISAWAFYIPAVAAISYMLYVRKSKDVKLSNTLTPLFGEKFKHRWIGKTLDIIVVFGIIASITTSLGLGVPVMSTLISSVFSIKNGIGLQLCVFAIWFLIFGWSVFRGLDKGIKKLTNINMAIIFGFLFIIILLIPMSNICEMELNSIGLYIEKLPRMIFYTDPFGNQQFVHDWTLFYWGWWLSFLPIMGIFIAKISRGRTLKQTILGQMIWGSLGCCTFLAVLGGYSLYLQKNGIVDLVSILETKGNAGVVLAIMKTLPFSKILIILLIILCFVFLATTIDSTALVLGTATSKKLNPEDDPHLYNRFSWAIAIFAIAIGLTVVGGLSLIQKFAIVLGFPLIFIVILITISALKAMKQDFGNKTKEEIIEICQKAKEKNKKHEKERTEEYEQ